jgi:hypothetical protein
MTSKKDRKDLMRELFFATVVASVPSQHSTKRFNAGFAAGLAKAARLAKMDDAVIFKTEEQASDWAKLECPVMKNRTNCEAGCHKCTSAAATFVNFEIN